MLDIKFIRENSDLIKLASTKKCLSFNVDELIALDGKRLEILKTIEELRAQQNVASDAITKATQEERNGLIDSMRRVKDDLGKKEVEMEEIMKSWRALMLAVPNIPDMSVPEGSSDVENIEVKKWGTVP
nr:hypothetical protein [Candidatus Paceibacterota bacterium]